MNVINVYIISPLILMHTQKMNYFVRGLFAEHTTVSQSKFRQFFFFLDIV